MTTKLQSLMCVQGLAPSIFATGNYLDWLTAEVGKELDDWQDLGDTVEQWGEAPTFAHLKFFDGWRKRNVHQTYMQFEAAR